MGGPQNFTRSVPRATLGVSSQNYSSNQQYNTGLHPYGMPREPTVASRPPAYSYMRPAQPAYNQPPSRLHADSYMRAVQPTYNQPSSMYTNRGPTAINEGTPVIIPIAGLNPYQGRWTIKARVTAKGELRHYNNAKGDGKVFSFDLLDSDGGEIRTTCFNAVADQFFDQIEVGEVYFISKGSIKPAQKAFNHLKNDHEITLDHTSTIQPCLDDGSIPKQQFHFRPIAEIEYLENNTILDIIGVVYSIKPSTSLTRKNNTETIKRNLSMKDMSGRSVEVTLWGNFCNKEGETLQNMCDSGTCPVLAVKAARVGEFNGKTVGTIATSQLCIEPDSPEARELRTWYDNVGKHTPAVSLSHETLSRADARKTISQIKDENLGTNSEKVDWITVSAFVSYIKDDNFFYPACPLHFGERICQKKVTKNSEDKWQCNRCEETVDECDYRYLLHLQIQDHTGFTWTTAFQESGEVIMGMSAKDLNYIRNEEQDEERFSEIVRNALNTKYNFKLKVKEESYNDEQRVKSTIVKVEKIKYSTDTRFLLDLLLKEDSKNGILVGASAPMNNVMGSVITASGVGQSQMGRYGYQNSGSASVVTQQAGLPASQMGRYGYPNNGSASVVTQQAGLPASQMGRYGYPNNGSASVVAQQAGLPASQMGRHINQYGGSATFPCGVTAGQQASETGQYGNYYGGSRQGVSCSSCGGVGHSVWNCPSAVNCSGGRYNDSMPSVGGNSNFKCYKCEQLGHLAKDCPGVNNVSTAYGGGGNVAPGRYGNASGRYVGGR